MKNNIFILFLILATTTISRGQTGEIEKEIDGALDELLIAYNEFDGAKIKALMVQDKFCKYIYQGYIRSSDTWDKMTPEIKKEQYYIFNYKWIEKNIKIFNSTSALAICKLSLTWENKNQGGPVTTNFVDTIVLQKKEKDWLITTIHSSVITENRTF